MFNGILTGLGLRGMHWVNILRQRQAKDCQLVAYVEPSEANRKRAIEQFAVPEAQIYPSLNDAVKKVKADFVLDVTPPAVHHDIARDAFAAGLHVVGEKPLSDDYAVAKRVVEMGKKSGLRHMIAQNYRFGWMPRATRKALADGKIGKPGQCDVRFYMNWADMPGTYYTTQPYMLINDMMVHHFDLLRYILAADPIAVQAITWNHPWSWLKGDSAHVIVFEYPGGLMATHTSVGCAVGERTTYNGDWRIEGPGGTISWDSDSRIWRTHLHRTDHPVREQIFQLPGQTGEQAILDEFFAAIRENRDPECSTADNIKSVAMVFAAIKSAKERRRVTLDELN